MLVDIRKTSEVIPDLNNMKPYRTKAQKRQALASAVRNHLGYYNSPSPYSFHPHKDDKSIRGNLSGNLRVWHGEFRKEWKVKSK